MRAELFIDLQMVSFGEKMHIDLTHNGSIAVGVVNGRAGAIPAHEMNSIIHLATHPGQNGLKKSLTPQSLRWKSLLPITREHNAHFLGVRTDNAHSEIIAHPMP